MNASITVEFLAGTTTEQAVTEARDMAVKLQVAYVKFNFNGVSVSIGRQANIQNGADAILAAMNTKHKFVVENGQ